MNTKRVLFVAYQFPPAGGIGVHRVVKFVKFLPEFGWDSTVLTVANPSVPLVDNSHQSDIPDSTKVVRARTMEPGYHWKQKVSASSTKGDSKKRPSRLKAAARGMANFCFQPDMQILWAPAAIKAGLKELKRTPHDAIIATAPPFSSFYVGEQLAKKSGLPLILDYRDEWGISNSYWENKQQDPVSRRIQTRMQHRILRHASAAIATTPSSCESIRQTASEAGANTRCDYIYNGFDPADFTPAGPKKDYGNGVDRFRLTYAGTLWNLNSIEPVVEAICKLQEQSPQLLNNLELVFAGRRTAEQEALLDRLDALNCACVRLPFIPHDEAVTLMQTSDCLLLLNSDLPGAERIVNGKIFEYFAAEKPFLLVSPCGDMWDLSADCPYALPCRPNRPDKLARLLGDELERHHLKVSREPGLWTPGRHERRTRAGQLAALLDQLAISPAAASHTPELVGSPD